MQEKSHTLLHTGICVLVLSVIGMILLGGSQLSIWLMITAGGITGILMRELVWNGMAKDRPVVTDSLVKTLLFVPVMVFLMSTALQQSDIYQHKHLREKLQQEISELEQTATQLNIEREELSVVRGDAFHELEKAITNATKDDEDELDRLSGEYTEGVSELTTLRQELQGLTQRQSLIHDGGDAMQIEQIDADVAAKQDAVREKETWLSEKEAHLGELKDRLAKTAADLEEGELGVNLAEAETAVAEVQSQLDELAEKSAGMTEEIQEHTSAVEDLQTHLWSSLLLFEAVGCAAGFLLQCIYEMVAAKKSKKKKPPAP